MLRQRRAVVVATLACKLNATVECGVSLGRGVGRRRGLAVQCQGTRLASCMVQDAVLYRTHTPYLGTLVHYVSVRAILVRGIRWCFWGNSTVIGVTATHLVCHLHH